MNIIVHLMSAKSQHASLYYIKLQQFYNGLFLIYNCGNAKFNGRVVPTKNNKKLARIYS